MILNQTRVYTPNPNVHIHSHKEITQNISSKQLTNTKV